MMTRWGWKRGYWARLVLMSCATCSRIVLGAFVGSFDKGCWERIRMRRDEAIAF